MFGRKAASAVKPAGFQLFSRKPVDHPAGDPAHRQLTEQRTDMIVDDFTVVRIRGFLYGGFLLDQKGIEQRSESAAAVRHIIFRFAYTAESRVFLLFGLTIAFAVNIAEDDLSILAAPLDIAGFPTPVLSFTDVFSRF